MAQDFSCIELSLEKYLDKPLVVKDVTWGNGFGANIMKEVAKLLWIKKGRYLILILGVNRKEKKEARKKCEASKKVRSYRCTWGELSWG